MIVGYIGAAISFFICVFCLRKNKNILNPGTVFCGLWSVILLLSSMKLYDLKDCSSATYIRLISGVMAFGVGYLFDFYIFKRKTIEIRHHYYGNATYEYIPRYTIIWIIVVCMLIEGLIGAKDSVVALMNGANLDALRQMSRATHAATRRTIGNVIHNLVTGPMEFALYPICAYNIINERQKKLSAAIVAILLLHMIKSGGRSNLIFFIIALCVSFSFAKHHAHLTGESVNLVQKNKKRFRIVIVTLVAVFLLASISRSGQKLIQHSYLYFAMEPTMFEQWSEIVKNNGLYGYGEASFNGFTFHILYILKNVLDSSYPTHWYEVFNTILKVDSDWKMITNAGLPANAYASVFWYFYIDGREFGIVALSALYGIFASYYFRKALKHPNIKNVCLYSLILFGIFDTYVRMRFAVGEYAGGFLILSFLIFKRKRQR